MKRGLSTAILGIAVCVSACATHPPVLAPDSRVRVLEVREGLASFYGENFQGQTTASGRKFDMNAMVAAHPRYPFGTLVRVTNLANGQSVTVRIDDRGPARKAQDDGVIIDVSRRAADALGFIKKGRIRVRLEVIEWGRA